MRDGVEAQDRKGSDHCFMHPFALVHYVDDTAWEVWHSFYYCA